MRMVSLVVIGMAVLVSAAQGQFPSNMALFVLIGQKNQADDGQKNQKDHGQANQKDDGQANQNDDGQGQTGDDARGKVTRSDPVPTLPKTDLKRGRATDPSRSNAKKVVTRRAPANNGKISGAENQKDDGQRNQKDDGQRNQKDDGQRHQKDDGQQNQAHNDP